MQTTENSRVLTVKYAVSFRNNTEIAESLSFVKKKLTQQQLCHHVCLAIACLQKTDKVESDFLLV